MKSSTNSKSTQIDFSENNDLYSISINSLVLSKTFHSIEELKDLLESKGYYGRIKVKKVDTVAKDDVRIKLEVYLPDSIVSYEWPFSSTYSLKKAAILKRKRPSAIKNNWKLLKCMYFLLKADYVLEDLDSAAQDGYIVMGWATKKEYVEMLRFLVKCNLIREGKFVLKTEQDVKEVYENLFDHVFFSLD